MLARHYLRCSNDEDTPQCHHDVAAISLTPHADSTEIKELLFNIVRKSVYNPVQLIFVPYSSNLLIVYLQIEALL